MNHDRNPSEIEELKAILAKSLDQGEGDAVPPLPESLRDRISGQYGRTAAAAPSPGVFAKLASLFAQPAWAGAAAAVVLLLVAGVMFVNPGGDTMRGTGSGEPPLIIVLYKVNGDTERALRESGYFEAQALRVVDTQEELDAITPPRIVIDGSTGGIFAHAEGSASVRMADIPDDSSRLADSVAEVLQEWK